MDIFCILRDESNRREFRIIELKTKNVEPNDYLNQLVRYIRWTISYLFDPGDIIQPVWVTTVAPPEHLLQKYREIGSLISEEFQEFNCKIPQIWHLRFEKEVIAEQLL